MALVYLDPTALVRLSLPTPGSELVAALWDRADAVVTSRMSEVQVRALLAGARRGGRVSSAQADEAHQRWATLREGIAFLEFTGPAADRTGELADAGLSALGAVQVAAALTVQHADTVVASWDPAVAGALQSHGMRVVP
jgi:hypothetical protein